MPFGFLSNLELMLACYVAFELEKNLQTHQILCTCIDVYQAASTMLNLSVNIIEFNCSGKLCTING